MLSVKEFDLNFLRHSPMLHCRRVVHISGLRRRLLNLCLITCSNKILLIYN